MDGSPLRPSTVSAATIVVDTEADEFVDDDACSLREAISNASGNGDFSDGDCEEGSGEDTITFANGLERIVLESNFSSISDVNLTTIDGGGDITLDGDNLYRVITVAAGGNVLLTDITITQGASTHGAGIQSFGNLEIIDSQITDNHASGSGGGVWTSSSSSDAMLVIRNSTVSGNSAASVGGGIYILDDHVEIYDSFVDDNDALDGGGIFISAGQPSGTLILERTSVTLNTAVSDGGGILNLSDEVEIIDSTISRNEAGDNGGGIATFSNGPLAVLTLNRSTVDHNEARISGGGIYNFGSDVHITNSTISTNEITGTGGGGGLFNEDTQSSTMTLVNVTVAFNISSPLSSNSGIHNASSIPDQVSLRNTIVAENDPVDCSGEIDSAGNNLDSDGTCVLEGTGDISNGDAELGPLQDNGGYTETHALLTGSDAIDTGSNAGCAADPVDNTDQREELRPEDGDNTGSSICDIGAYEAPGPEPTPSPTETPIAIATSRPNIGGALSGLFAGQPTPLPTAQAAAAPQVIRPPSTGNAGLR